MLVTYKYDNSAMKCGRMGSFYSWRHLVCDSQMGWLKLIFGPRRGRSCICDRQIIARGVHPPGGNQRDSEQRREERVTEGVSDGERQRARPQSKCLTLAETN